MSPTIQVMKESMMNGILNSILYFVLGILFLMFGYTALNFVNKRYNLNEEIGNGNVAAGIMVFGIFVGLALVISGVIY